MAGRVGSSLQSTAAIGLAKTLLTIFNVIFIASGLAIMLLGAYMHMELYRFISLSTLYYDAVPYVMIGIGFGILLVGCLGCVCTIKGHGKMLYLFSALLVLVFVLELATAVSAFIFKSHIEAGFNEGLSSAMREYNEDVNKHYGIDGIQIRFKCCGKDSFADWLNVNVTGQSNGSIPISCCKRNKCDLNDEGQVYHQGCFMKLSTFMQHNFAMIGGVAVGFSLFQMLGALLSCCLAKSINKAKYEQVD